MYVSNKKKKISVSRKKNLFKDSYFCWTLQSFSWKSHWGSVLFWWQDLSHFCIFYWSPGVPVGKPQPGTSSQWLWFRGRIIPTAGGQVALSPGLQPAATLGPSPARASASDRCRMWPSDESRGSAHGGPFRIKLQKQVGMLRHQERKKKKLMFKNYILRIVKIKNRNSTVLQIRNLETQGDIVSLL